MRKKSSMNLLIVDDHPTNLKLLRAQFEAEGHAVFEAHAGVDALAVLERQRVDAVISDILMPRMHGYRLCYEIRMHARLRDLPIILCTSAYTSPGDEKQGFDVGADKFLKRPVSLETLVAALHEVIARPHAAPRPEALQEVEVLKKYSERLVNKLEEKNTELQAGLRALVGRLHTAREEEAKRIARELHDDLGQQLTALNMELADLEMKLPGAAPTQRSQIARMHTIVDHTIQIVQKIAGELRLAQLDVLGLTAAIDWQLKEFYRRSAIPSRITRLDEVANLSDAQSTAVFRILQETLTNIVRHAGATVVEVSLQAEPDQLTLKVHDNGRGISAAELNDQKSIGLLGMRERAQLVGGDVTITGGAGVGTTVLIRIPLNRTGAIPA